MTSRAIVESIETFLASYRAAFERADAGAVAGHFADRVQVASDTGQGVRVDVLAGDEWRSAVERLIAAYGALGVSAAIPTDVAVSAISERLALAAVGWSLRDRDGGVVYEFRALYTLARGAAVSGGATDWRIVAIAHDEIAQARAQADVTRGTARDPRRS
jgi:hypothetical protein